MKEIIKRFTLYCLKTHTFTKQQKVEGYFRFIFFSKPYVKYLWSLWNCGIFFIYSFYLTECVFLENIRKI